jgi:hypothetical protein
MFLPLYVFELVRRVHIHPEQDANGSSKALLLKELEKAEKKTWLIL